MKCVTCCPAFPTRTGNLRAESPPRLIQSRRSFVVVPVGGRLFGTVPVSEAMQETYTRILEMFRSNLPGLLAAVAILIIGWLAAFVIAAVVRWLMKRTHLDDRLAIWLGDDDTAPHDTFERWIPRAVYYLVLLFVLVQFLRRLGLTLVAAPLTALLDQISEFAPRIGGAALLLVAAWVLASILRAAVVRVLRATNFEERLGAAAALDQTRKMSIAQTLGDAVYWLIFLLFLPAVLDTLELQGPLAPVQSMMDKVLGFLPNLFAAALIAAAGWFVARIVQQITANLLAALGVDQLSESFGLDTLLGKQRLSSVVGLIVYVLVLIPVLVAALNALDLDAITDPASNMLETILAAIPLVFAASLLLTIAYVVGRVVGGLIGNLLAGIGFNRVLVRLGIVGEEEGDRRNMPSAIVGYLVRVAVVLFAAVEASRLLGFEVLADLVAQFLVFSGQVLLGLVIFAIGLYLANLSARVIEASEADQANLLALAARVSILALAGAMGLSQMGLAADIINLAFGIILGAVALAVALAFGFGGREVAARQLDDWKRRWDQR